MIEYVAVAAAVKDMAKGCAFVIAVLAVGVGSGYLIGRVL